MASAGASSPLLRPVVVLIALHTASVSGYLSPLCCGDNFCCAVMATNTVVQCWGGNSASRWPDSNQQVKAIACGGKSLVTVNDADEISGCMGTDGYGRAQCEVGCIVGC
jgi:hypothetical protein